MAEIRPNQLPAAANVNPAAAIIVDAGGPVEKATPIQVVDAAIPLASQAEAEAGEDNVKRVTSLRVKQAIDALADLSLRPDLSSTATGEGAALVGVQRPETDSVAQTAFEIMTRVVTPSPLSFGAVGDGVTDDTAAIIKTIQRTGRLFLPAGTWLCDAEALINPTLNPALDGISITGEGPMSVLQFDDGGLRFSGNVARNAILRNFRILGTGTGQTLLSLEDIDVNSAPTRWMMDNVHLSSVLPNDNVGLHIRGGWIGQIVNPVIRGLSTGMLITQSADGPQVAFNGLNVFGGEIQGNVTGVDMRGALNINYFGTAIEGNRGNGAILRSGSRSISFMGAYFEANGIDDPVNTNDIRIETDGPESTIYSVKVDDGCTFLRGTVGCEDAIWADRCIALEISEGASFNGYENTLVIEEAVPGTVTGAYRARSAGRTLPVINNSTFFGDTHQIITQMGALDLPPSVLTSSPEVPLTLSEHASNQGAFSVYYTATDAGPVALRIELFDATTGVALTIISETQEASVGINIWSGIANWDIRDMKGKTTMIRAARNGAAAGDTNVGSILLQSLELQWND